MALKSPQSLRHFLGVPYVTVSRALSTYATELLPGYCGRAAIVPTRCGMGASVSQIPLGKSTYEP